MNMQQRRKEELMLRLERDVQDLVENALRWPTPDVPSEPLQDAAADRAVRRFRRQATRVLRKYFLALRKLEGRRIRWIG